MYTENANRAESGGAITPENLEPNPKNPIIAAFFRNIGLADELGSGVRNLYHYVKRYSGKDPELLDGDVFRIIVPLYDSYSADADTDKPQINHADFGINETQQKITALMAANPEITAGQIAASIDINKRQVEMSISKLKSLGIIATRLEADALALLISAKRGCSGITLRGIEARGSAAHASD